MGLNSLVGLEAILPKQPHSSFERDIVRERCWGRDKQELFLYTDWDNSILIEFIIYFLLLYMLCSKDVMLGAWKHPSISQYGVKLCCVFFLNIVLILYSSLSYQKDIKDVLPRSNLQFRVWMTVLVASTLEATKISLTEKTTVQPANMSLDVLRYTSILNW